MRQSDIRDFYQGWMQKVSALDLQHGSRRSFEKFMALLGLRGKLYICDTVFAGVARL